MSSLEKLLNLTDQADRWAKIANPLGPMQASLARLTKLEDVYRRAAGPAWLHSPASGAMQRLAQLQQPLPASASVARGLMGFEQRFAASPLAESLARQTAAFDKLNQNPAWARAAGAGSVLFPLAALDRWQNRLDSLFARVTASPARDAAATTTLSNDLLALGTELLVQGKVNNDTTAKLLAMAERVEQATAVPTAPPAAANTSAGDLVARESLAVAQRALRLQYFGLLVSWLLTILAMLQTHQLAQQAHEPAAQARTQQQYDKLQQQLVAAVAAQSAPPHAERIATRSVAVRERPQPTGPVSGRLLRATHVSVWNTHGKWAFISYLDVDGLPAQGWVRRNCLAWPEGAAPGKKAQKKAKYA